MKLISETRLPLVPFQLDDPPTIFQFVANESYIVTAFARGDNNVHVLSTRTGDVLQKQPFKSRWRVTGLVLDGSNLIITCIENSNLMVYHIPSETVVYTLPCLGCQGIYTLTSIHCDAEESVVAAIHLDGSICIWDLRARKRLYTIKPHNDIAWQCSVVGSKMATSSTDGTLAVSDWQSGQILWRKRLGEADTCDQGVDGVSGTRGCPVFAQADWDGKVAVATEDGVVRVFEFETGAQLAEWQAADGLIQVLIPYNDWLISISWGELKLWSIETYQLLNSVRLFDRVVTEFAIVAGTIVCYGRDATQDSDRCGLDAGLKTWNLNLDDSTTSQSDSSVKRFGGPLRAPTGLVRLIDDQVAVCVLRGAAWFVQKWQVI